MKFQPGLEVSWLGINSAGAKLLVIAVVNVNNNKYDKDMLMRKLVICEFWVILYLTLS